MRSFADRVVRLLASVIICGVTIAVSTAANAQQEAITATVIDENIQKVGFRAMIQKQAIMYNLAGYARNNPDGTVGVVLAQRVRCNLQRPRREWRRDDVRHVLRS
jgi:acylphosphatase